MPFTAKYLEDHRIVYIETIGEMTYEDYRRQTEDCIALSKQYGTGLYLNDIRQLVNRARLSDVISIYELYSELGQSRDTKLAMVADRKQKDYEIAKIFEVSCTLRRWNVRIFTGVEQAIEWLLA